MFVMGENAYLSMDVKDALLLESDAYLRPSVYLRKYGIFAIHE